MNGTKKIIRVERGGRFGEGGGHDLSDPSNVAFKMSDRSPEYVNAAVTALIADGIKPSVEKNIDPDKLRATQFELNAPDEDRAEKGSHFPQYADKPIVFRENGTGLLHVVDGHNRLSEAVRGGDKMPSVYQFDGADLDKALEKKFATKYPGPSKAA